MARNGRRVRPLRWARPAGIPAALAALAVLAAAASLPLGCTRGQGLAPHAAEAVAPVQGTLGLGEGEVLAVHDGRSLALARFALRTVPAGRRALPEETSLLLDPNAFLEGSPVLLVPSGGAREELPVGRILSVCFGEEALALVAVEPAEMPLLHVPPSRRLRAKGAATRAALAPSGYARPSLPAARDADPFVESAVAAVYLVVGPWETAGADGPAGWHASPAKRRRIERFVRDLTGRWSAWDLAAFEASTSSEERFARLLGLWRERARASAEIARDARDLAAKRWRGAWPTEAQPASESALAERLAAYRKRRAEATEAFLLHAGRFRRAHPYAQRPCALLALLEGSLHEASGDRNLARSCFHEVLDQWPGADSDATLTAFIRIFKPEAGIEATERALEDSIPEALRSMPGPGKPPPSSPAPRATDLPVSPTATPLPRGGVSPVTTLPPPPPPSHYLPPAATPKPVPPGPR